MPTKKILDRVIKSAINIIKEEPLREIVNSTMIESTQIEVLRNILQLAIPTTTSITSDSYVVFKNEKYMQNMVAATISVIQDEPVSNIVDSITTKTMLSWHLKQTLSAPIDTKVDTLLGIITTQCKMLNSLKADMKLMKANTL